MIKLHEHFHCIFEHRDITSCCSLLPPCRVLSSKVTRVSVAAALSLEEHSHLPTMDASLGVQGGERVRILLQ